MATAEESGSSSLRKSPRKGSSLVEDKEKIEETSNTMSTRRRSSARTIQEVVSETSNGMQIEPSNEAKTHEPSNSSKPSVETLTPIGSPTIKAESPHCTPTSRRSTRSASDSPEGMAAVIENETGGTESPVSCTSASNSPRRTPRSTAITPLVAGKPREFIIRTRAGATKSPAGSPAISPIKQLKTYGAEWSDIKKTPTMQRMGQALEGVTISHEEEESMESEEDAGESVRLRTIVKNSEGEDVEKDFYCWVCHKEGELTCCEWCPRSFHTKCLASSVVVAEDWICPECQLINTAESADTQSKAMTQLTMDQLCLALRYVIQRMTYPDAEPFQQPVDVVQNPHYRDYIIHSMDLSTLEKNRKQKRYGSTEAFLADVKWILHNCVIFNGGTNQNKLTAVAKHIVKVCKHETSEIEVCPDCFMNSFLRRKNNWFCEPCRTPHTLVWAKMKGYPFWPGKVLRMDKNQQVDVRFFGEHDRAWCPLNQVFMLSKKPPIPLKMKRAGFDLSVDECEQHIRRLEEHYGGFRYAPNSTSYQPEHDPVCGGRPRKFKNKAAMNEQVKNVNSKPSLEFPGEDSRASTPVKVVKDQPESMRCRSQSPVVRARSQTPDSMKDCVVSLRMLSPSKAAAARSVTEKIPSATAQMASKVINKYKGAKLRQAVSPVKGKPKSMKGHPLAEAEEIDDAAEESMSLSEQVCEDQSDSDETTPMDTSSNEPTQDSAPVEKTDNKETDGQEDLVSIEEADGSRTKEQSRPSPVPSGGSDSGDKGVFTISDAEVDKIQSNQKINLSLPPLSTKISVPKPTLQNRKLVHNIYNQFQKEEEEVEEEEEVNEEEEEPMDIAAPMKTKLPDEATVTVSAKEDMEASDTKSQEKQPPEKQSTVNQSLEKDILSPDEGSSPPAPVAVVVKADPKKNRFLGKLVESCAKKLHEEDASEDEEESDEGSDSESSASSSDGETSDSTTHKTQDREVPASKGLEGKTSAADSSPVKESPGKPTGQVNVEPSTSQANTKKASSEPAKSQDSEMNPTHEAEDCNDSEPTAPENISMETDPEADDLVIDTDRSSSSKTDVPLAASKSEAAVATEETSPGGFLASKTLKRLLLTPEDGVTSKKARTETHDISANSTPDHVSSDDKSEESTAGGIDAARRASSGSTGSEPPAEAETTWLSPDSVSQERRQSAGSTDAQRRQSVGSTDAERRQSVGSTDAQRRQSVGSTDAERRPSTSSSVADPSISLGAAGDMDDVQVDVSQLNLTKYMDKAQNALQGIFQEMCKDLLETEAKKIMRQHFHQEIDQLKWSHRQELLELAHNTELTVAEMRLGWDNEKQKMGSDFKALLQREKKKVVRDAKSKQWCAMCGEEAQFYCCWNTSYCNYPCQQAHWPEHMSSCAQASEKSAGKTPASAKTVVVNKSTPAAKSMTKVVNNLNQAGRGPGAQIVQMANKVNQNMSSIANAIGTKPITIITPVSSKGMTPSSTATTMSVSNQSSTPMSQARSQLSSVLSQTGTSTSISISLPPKPINVQPLPRAVPYHNSQEMQDGSGMLKPPMSGPVQVQPMFPPAGPNMLFRLNNMGQQMPGGNISLGSLPGQMGNMAQPMGTPLGTLSMRGHPGTMINPNPAMLNLNPQQMFQPRPPF